MLLSSIHLVTSGTDMINVRTKFRFVTVILLLCGLSGTSFADTRTVAVVIPWEGQGQVFPIGTNELRFQGSIEGIMYVESAEGEMNEAFVQCPIVQSIDISSQSISSTGNCTIVVSTEDAVFAEGRVEFAGLGVDRIELVSHRRENALGRPILVLPIAHAPALPWWPPAAHSPCRAPSHP